MKKKLVMMLALLTMCFTFSSCSSDDDFESYPKAINITAGSVYQEHKFNGWDSEEPLIASIENGEVKGNIVGKTCITNGKQKIQVTVNAKYNDYIEPCISWGCSLASVKSYMEQYSNLELIYINDNSAAYTNGELSNLLGYIYLFDNNLGRLKSSSLIISINDYNTNVLPKFLSERYIYAGQKNDVLMFVSIDRKTGIALTVQYNKPYYYYLVMYMDYTSSGTRTNILTDINIEMDRRIEDIKACLNNLEK